MLGHSALGEQPLGAFQSTITLLAAANGTFTLTGQDALFATFSGYAMFGGTGAFALSGQGAGLARSRFPLAAGVGSFALTGVNADFIHILAGDAASFALTGQAADLRYDRLLAGDADAFALTGQNLALRLAVTRLPVEVGEFTLTVQPARATHHYTINRAVTGLGFRFELDDTLTAGER